MRGNVLRRADGPKRNRSTRRRQDAPDLPRRAKQDTTLGADVHRLRREGLPAVAVRHAHASLLRRVRNGVPVDPARYDYRRAARDALHFSKLVDRFVQNLRRVAGYDVQYFATVEPQKRLAPHLHMAIRGTMPRAEVKAIAAATYHQVWWPSVDEVRFDGDHLPVWVERAEREDGTPTRTGRTATTSTRPLGKCCPPGTRRSTGSTPTRRPNRCTWCASVTQVDVQGVARRTPDADQRIGYLAST